MKQYTFKDGFKCVAGSVEEAKAKHKVTASDSNYAGRDILRKLGFHPDDGDFVLNLDLKYRFFHLLLLKQDLYMPLLDILTNKRLA